MTDDGSVEVKLIGLDRPGCAITPVAGVGQRRPWNAETKARIARDMSGDVSWVEKRSEAVLRQAARALKRKENERKKMALAKDPQNKRKISRVWYHM